MQKKFSVNIEERDQSLMPALEYVRERLRVMNLTEKDLNRAELMFEESLSALLKGADFSRISYFVVNVRKLFGDVIIDIRVPGEEFDFYGSAELPYHIEDDELLDTQEAVRGMLLRSFGDYLRYRHYRRFNSVRIKALLSNYSDLYRTLTVLILAVLSGIALKEFFPESVYMFVNDNIYVPVRTVFMNGLKMCAVPVVLFSIITCISEIGNISDIKKAGGKLIKYFVIFQIVSVSIAFSLMYIFRPGTGVNMPVSSGNIKAVQGGTVSLTGMLINLVPSNLIRPLLEGDMLPVMVIAVITGISVGLSEVRILREVFSELRTVFMRATGIFMRIVLLAMFCSISSLVITTGFDTLLSLLGILLTLTAGYILLNIFFCLIVKLRTGLSPLIMLKKSLPMITTAFSTCSSMASVTDSMKCCDDMGIYPKMYTLSIPLGTSICKASYPIILSIITLSGANMYGIELTLSQMISLGLSVIMLTVSTPGLPGGGIIAISALLTQVGCPLEFLGIALSLDVIDDLVNTPTTCMGNIASTIIAVDAGKLINREKYNS